MVAISTILFCANLLALIINKTPLFSFWWNVFAYGIEIALYLIIFVIIAIAAALK